MSMLKNFHPYLDIIKFPMATKSAAKFPKTFTQVLQEVPREILVHDEHTGASRCKAPGELCKASSRASLG